MEKSKKQQKPTKKSAKSRNTGFKFKIGDKVVLLSKVSSTPEKSCCIFIVEDFIVTSGCLIVTPMENQNAQTLMRPEKCFVKAKQIMYSGEIIKAFDAKSLSEVNYYDVPPEKIASGKVIVKKMVLKDAILTVECESKDSYRCFETGSVITIPKESCDEVYPGTLTLKQQKKI